MSKVFKSKDLDNNEYSRYEYEDCTPEELEIPEELFPSFDEIDTQEKGVNDACIMLLNYGGYGDPDIETANTLCNMLVYFNQRNQSLLFKGGLGDESGYSAAMIAVLDTQTMEMLILIQGYAE